MAERVVLFQAPAPVAYILFYVIYISYSVHWGQTKNKINSKVRKKADAACSGNQEP